MSNVDMASFVKSSQLRAHRFLCDADPIDTCCRTGNATESLVATRDGCATVVHADMRGLITSRQVFVAGLPSL
jgi:hypothetical protein